MHVLPEPFRLGGQEQLLLAARIVVSEDQEDVRVIAAEIVAQGTETGEQEITHEIEVDGASPAPRPVRQDISADEKRRGALAPHGIEEGAASPRMTVKIGDEETAGAHRAIPGL